MVQKKVGFRMSEMCYDKNIVYLRCVVEKKINCLKKKRKEEWVFIEQVTTSSHLVKTTTCS
jgi:hypothetical protein